MADGRANIALSIGLIFLLLILKPDNCIRLLGETDDLDKTSLIEKKLLNVNSDNTRDHVLAPMPIFRRHLGLVLNTRWGFHHRRVSRYPNSDSTFQLIRLAISGDIKLNPGPSTLGSSTKLKKLCCQTCSRTIAHNHRMLTCNLCVVSSITLNVAQAIQGNYIFWPEELELRGVHYTAAKVLQLRFGLVTVASTTDPLCFFDGRLVYCRDRLWRDWADLLVCLAMERRKMRVIYQILCSSWRPAR